MKFVPRNSLNTATDKTFEASQANKRVVAGLEPAPIWDRFAELAAIPRKSGEEAAVRQYIQNIAVAHGLAYQSDAVGNLVVYVPGKGLGASKEPVILQGHMDMVCKSEPGSSHNFLTDPIRLELAIVDGTQVLKARGTTLGADNGMGVCTALGLLDDPSITNHPPLELLFTVDEEVGLNGARGLDPKLLSGRRLINMDSEDGPGEIYISCAGGRDLEAVWTLKREVPTSEMQPLKIKVSGFPGGHSGMEIQNPCGNAIFCLIDLVTSCTVPLSISAFNAGAARNAIPAEAEVILWLTPADSEKVKNKVADKETCAKFARQSGYEGEVQFEVQQVDRGTAAPPFNPTETRRSLDAIRQVPHGVFEWSNAIPGLVQTSNNVAVVSTREDGLALQCMSRSSRNGAVEDFQDNAALDLRESGAEVVFSSGYSGWEADSNNPLLHIASNALQRVTGTTPEVKAVHAGLECGVLCGRLAGLKAISFGPIIRKAHTPEEYVLPESLPPFYAALKELLHDLCMQPQ